MTNNTIFEFILRMFRQVIQLASDIKVYDDNGISVSVLQFFIALAILFIVLSALLNFVKVQSVNNVGRVSTSVGHIKNWNQARKELKGRDDDGVLSWMFESGMTT